MTTYSVYVRGEADDALRKEARNLGITPIELIKKRLDLATQSTSNHAIETKIDALFFLLEMVATEVGYTSGATRAASASAPAAVSRGNEFESNLKKAIAQVRSRLEKQGAEVRI